MKMLEDQVAFLLQKYLGNYVRGFNKDALKISVWKGDVELTNMQLKPEALNALKLPVKVKAGFLGSVRLKIPWTRLGHEPVLVYLDRILMLAEPETQVEGHSEDTLQEAKKARVKELEIKLLESQQHLQSEMNKSWLGSFIGKIIGNLKLSITNIHIRYEDSESNPGHPFASGLTLARLSAITVDDLGMETFATGGALDHIQKSIELQSLAVYFDSDTSPWSIKKPWEDLLPSEWSEIFELGVDDDRNVNVHLEKHSYILEPVTGDCSYKKSRLNESESTGQPLQKAAVNLDNVTLSLSKAGYRDILKMAENFANFNQRLRYAHYRPSLPVKSDPRSWWKYAYKSITHDTKKASGKLSWEQVLRSVSLRKKYISLYASLLQSDVSRLTVDDNDEINKLDRELDIEVIIQWRMLAHKFLEQSLGSDLYQQKQKAQPPWQWLFGWSGTNKDDQEQKNFSEEDWERLYNIIGYKEGSDDFTLSTEDKDLFHFYLKVRMKRNATKLIGEEQKCLAELACEQLACSIKSYRETKVFNIKLDSYKLSSPYGLLAESATAVDSLVSIFAYKPFDVQVDWSLSAKASPCYVTYLKESIDEIVAFFDTSAIMSQTLALETAAAVQMTIDGVKRTAQEQMTKVLNEKSRFHLDLKIAAPKITIPTKFRPDDVHATQLLLDLGNLVLSTEELWGAKSMEASDLYLNFSLALSDVSAFLVDGNYQWSETYNATKIQANKSVFLPVIEKCGIVLNLQQIQSESPSYPSTRLAVRVPSLSFHFSPARYHRLMQVSRNFQENNNTDIIALPWSEADFKGWLSLLTWKGVGNREPVWQRRYVCLVGPYLYILENPESKTYKQCISLRGKQIHQIPEEYTDGEQNLLALHDAGQFNFKVMEDFSGVIFLCSNDESRKTWQSRIQGAIYRASGSAAIASLPEISSSTGSTKDQYLGASAVFDAINSEKLFVIGALDELKISLSCSPQSKQSWKNVLLDEESQLFEFRAVGSQVELSVKANDIFIGTILKSLEIEDQFYSKGKRTCYLARSFVESTQGTPADSLSSLSVVAEENSSQTSLPKTESQDQFFEALDNLDDLADYHVIRQAPPAFSRMPGLLPDAELPTDSLNFGKNNSLDSFVKAQFVIYDQSSPLYNNLDNRVIVTLATLSFFCRRPTVLAIMNFANAINLSSDDAPAEEYYSTPSYSVMSASESSPADNPETAIVSEPVIKGLLGKGKSRVIFHLTLNMATAQVFLMEESGTSLATLSQNNITAGIKVFTSSYRIRAALGNLKISDDSLPSDHPYFWICDMRNPGGSSFVELDFCSFTAEDEDYGGYDYSLSGQLSEVRIIYLHRFVLEVVSYFLDLVPNNTDTIVELKDNVINSDKWVNKTQIDGSPALKLDLSFDRPIIVLPRQTDSMDYLQLDVLHITVQNTFQWLGGDKIHLNAIHLETLTVKVKDINLTVGTGPISGETIIQDVIGLSLVIKRSLRDLLHIIPSTEASIQMDMLKAALTNREYEIITECSLTNFSETPRDLPSLDNGPGTSDQGHLVPSSAVASAAESESSNREPWITMKVSVSINLVELSLHSGISRDSPLATVQVSGAWLLYKSSISGDGFLFATLKDFSIIDDREGTKEELKLAIGKSRSIESMAFYSNRDLNLQQSTIVEKTIPEHVSGPVPSMLILDAKFTNFLTSISLCIQRPKLLVALDFLLAIAEFFFPSVRHILSEGEDNDPSHVTDAIIVDVPTYTQPSPVFTLSSKKCLVVDDERFDHFVYDGKGGKLFLQDRDGRNISYPCQEPIIYVGNGKKLQFKDITIMNGEFLDSCVFLGTGSSYSASEVDHVYLRTGETEASQDSNEETSNAVFVPTTSNDRSPEIVFEIQAVGPELAFYSTSKDAGESFVMSKVMHADLDMFLRLVVKGESIEITGKILGFKVDCNGIRVLEPFDSSLEFSNASGRTNIHFIVSDIHMNFSFSILKVLFALEEEVLAFFRMSSKKVSVVCSQFDRIATMDYGNGHRYAFWRPQAPSGFAVLGDCLTPLNEPPSRGVLAVNTSFVRVKRPLSYKLIWRSGPLNVNKGQHDWMNETADDRAINMSESCSIWFPDAPKGYVSVGCVVSTGNNQPSLSSSLCVLQSLVCPSHLKDCISFRSSSNVALWRVDNSFGSFLPTDSVDTSLIGKPYDLHRVILRQSDNSAKTSKKIVHQNSPENSNHAPQMERAGILTAGRLFEAVDNLNLIWCNQGASSQKKLSVWRPVVPPGMAFLGDIAVQGYERPNSAMLLHDRNDETILRAPRDFQLVGHIKKKKSVESISFWLPNAPTGYVALGCVASKGSPKSDDICSLRCIRSDMVTGDQFSEGSIWDTSEIKVSEPFSLWSVGNDLGTFLVRSGYKKPPRRFALNIASPTSGSDDVIIDGEIKTFSASVIDDCGGLMVPLFNVSLDKILFSLHGRQDYMNSSMSFSLAARSYNDRHDAWEPLLEPLDGFLRYQYNLYAPGAPTQLRITSTRDMNLNFSVSSANMMIQAYSSWNNLDHIEGSYKKIEKHSSMSEDRSVINVHQRRSHYVIPQNKLGQDIYIRTTEFNRVSDVIKLPSGDSKPIKVPILKNMLYSHSRQGPARVARSLVTIVIADAEVPTTKGIGSGEYALAIRLLAQEPTGPSVQQLSARTCGVLPEHASGGATKVNWGETFFFKVNSQERYAVEFIVTDLGRGEPIGTFSAELEQIACELPSGSNLYDFEHELSWKNLAPVLEGEDIVNNSNEFHGRVRCTVIRQLRSKIEAERNQKNAVKAFVIQISPTAEGPWTTVRLNYAASVACWRLGNNVVGSEITAKDNDKYVSIRSLVSVTNITDHVIDLRLVSKASESDENGNVDDQGDHSTFEIDEYFETEGCVTSIDWISCSSLVPSTSQSNQHSSSHDNQGTSLNDLPDGWEWVDDWHVDTSSVASTENLKSPESSEHPNSVKHARQRKWIRHRKYISCNKNNIISLGLVKSGETVPLPLSSLSHPVLSYNLQLTRKDLNDSVHHSWSVVLERHFRTEIPGRHENSVEISVSSLEESDFLLFCSQIDGTSSHSHKGLWFCVSIQAKEIGKDINSNPIFDWKIIVSSPISLVSYLPISAEFSVTSNHLTGENVTFCQGTLQPGESVNVNNADLRDPLYLTLLPHGEWHQVHEPVAISPSSKTLSKLIAIKSTISGRIVQVVIEQIPDKGRLIASVIRIYVPYWISIARCPPLVYRFMSLSGGREPRHFPVPFGSSSRSEKILWQIKNEEMVGGYTLASVLNFKNVGLSASISRPGKESFGPIKDLSPLGDMDGSVDLRAYDADRNCTRVLVSSKPCPYQAVPTKVISIRPFMEFTNRLGQDLFIKFSINDEPKILHASDSRASFSFHEVVESEKLQVRMEETDWCVPMEILKEDIITITLRKHHGSRRFLRAEVRGYEEGSRFLVVFSFGPADGPLRIENRISDFQIKIRQSGLDDSNWYHVEPCSATRFSWDDPYGLKLLDICVGDENISYVQKINLENLTDIINSLNTAGIHLDILELGDVKIVRFSDIKSSIQLGIHGKLHSGMVDSRGASSLQTDVSSSTPPMELIVELAVVGISLIDHKPRELLYLYLERLYISYSTGFNAGRTSRFKLIIGQLQLDNQLPLTVMPVLLAPVDSPDRSHPVFKTTITISNETAEGIQVYPYVYIRVYDRWWRLNIHEPIIWALVEFYKNLRIDSIPGSSDVAQVDPEMRIELIDVSEIRLKLSLETAPSQRPPGALGMWSPFLSAVGSALKIQVHLRKVMHRNRYMRKSAIFPAILNRIARDLIHNPLHLLFSIDVLGMTKSTLASLSKGFAELSTDGQFLQLRSKQVWSRRITGVGDGILQGTEAFAQGVAYGFTGVVRKPVESARQHGILGLAYGIGRAFVGIVAQPLSGALDFVSLTIDGIGASFARCLEILNNKATAQRIRNPRAIHSDGIIREYNEREAAGQMILYLAEATRHLGCTDLFKEPSKYAWSDFYEDHFIVPNHKVVLITSKRVMLLQTSAPDKMDRKPCKILWDVPWEELLALELAKGGYDRPSHLIIHLKNFRRSESFVRVVKCMVSEDAEQEPQAVIICSAVRKVWKEHQTNKKVLVLKVPSTQHRVELACDVTEDSEPYLQVKPLIRPGKSLISDERKFIKHTLNFKKLWSSEQEYKSRCTLLPKQVVDGGTICSIWRPLCPNGYVSVGDVAHLGTHLPHVAAVYQYSDENFALPLGYDLVWRNCAEDYNTPLTIWLPRAPNGYVAVGFVAFTSYEEPDLESAYCVNEQIAEPTSFEAKVWSAPDSFPWACYIYQIQSQALQFVALRQPKEHSDWTPKRVRDIQSLYESEATHSGR